MRKVLFLVRSVAPFKTQRRDVDYIISSLIENGYEVEIYDPKQKILMNVNHQKITDFNIFPKWLFVSKFYLVLNFLVLYRFLKKQRGAYDIVQINYVREEYLILSKSVKKLGKKLVLTLFGSDINSRNFVKNKFTKIYKYADTITCTNTTFAEKFCKLFEDQSIRDKVQLVMLPQDHFSLYKTFQIEDKNSAKITLGIPPDRVVITVGTNSTENEQHEKIIEEILQLENPDSYYLIFPLANRSGEKNKREYFLDSFIEKKLSKFDYKIINDFISYEEIAQIRLASDIFINLRQNDQLAASMLESNLAYSHVITGKWLPYEGYTKIVSVSTLSNFNQLPDQIKNYKEQCAPDTLIRNRAVVLQEFDADVLKGWFNCYEKLNSTR